MLIGAALPFLPLAALGPWCLDADRCGIPAEPCADPILPFSRFLERENRIARRIDAEAHLPRPIEPTTPTHLGTRLDILA